MSSLIDRIKVFTNNIRRKSKGEEVRSSIADGIDEIAETLQNTVDNQITEFSDFFSIKRPSSGSPTGKYSVIRGSINDSGVRSPNSGNETSCITNYITLTTPVIIKLDNNDGGSLSINRVRGYLHSDSTYTPEETWIANGDLSPTKSIFIKPSETRTHVCVSFQHLDGSSISNMEIDQLINKFAVYKETDAELETEGAPADAAATGTRLTEVEEDVDFLFSQNDAAVECYTDFEYFTGWYANDGSIGTSGRRTQPLKIRGGETYYLTDASNTSCLGAFLDRRGNWLAPLRGPTASNPDVVAISPSYTGVDNTYAPDQAALDEPDISAYPANRYMTLYKFTAPANAAYFVFNTYSATHNLGYKQSVCSKPIFMINGSGNIVIPSTDATYQRYKNKKLCMIGPSTVMINRLWRQNANGDMVNPTTVYGYIAGAQEYLKPFFADVVGLGFSGATYPYGSGEDTGRCSIYTRICGGSESFTFDEQERSYSITAPDLSGYDVFVLRASGNGFDDIDFGAWDDAVNSTYCGALRLIINSIRTQNPAAEIYLSNFMSTTVGSAKNLANVELQKLADDTSCRMIDFDAHSGFTSETYPYFKYDSKGHPNNLGNRMMGLFIRKEIIGF